MWFIFTNRFIEGTRPHMDPLHGMVNTNHAKRLVGANRPRRRGSANQRPRKDPNTPYITPPPNYANIQISVMINITAKIQSSFHKSSGLLFSSLHLSELGDRNSECKHDPWRFRGRYRRQRSIAILNNTME